MSSDCVFSAGDRHASKKKKVTHISTNVWTLLPQTAHKWRAWQSRGGHPKFGWLGRHRKTSLVTPPPRELPRWNPSLITAVQFASWAHAQEPYWKHEIPVSPVCTEVSIVLVARRQRMANGNQHFRAKQSLEVYESAMGTK